MEWGYFPRGLLIGLMLAVPVGPMAVLCIRRTLAQGRAIGLASGAGIATADAVYGAVAAFGLTSVSSLLVERQEVVRLGGGLFLCYLGWKIARARAADVMLNQDPSVTDRAAAFISTLGLTLTNPATILTFAAIFTGLGIAPGGGEIGPAVALVAGVFAGSVLWWIILTAGVGAFRNRLTPARLTGINRACGAFLGLFGGLAIVSTIR